MIVVIVGEHIDNPGRVSQPPDGERGKQALSKQLAFRSIITRSGERLKSSAGRRRVQIGLDPEGRVEPAGTERCRG
jgi:hypothetical protein